MITRVAIVGPSTMSPEQGLPWILRNFLLCLDFVHIYSPLQKNSIIPKALSIQSQYPPFLPCIILVLKPLLQPALDSWRVKLYNVFNKLTPTPKLSPAFSASFLLSSFFSLCVSCPYPVIIFILNPHTLPNAGEKETYFYFLFYRGKGGRNRGSQCEILPGCLPHVPWLGQACNPGMRPNWTPDQLSHTRWGGKKLKKKIS